MLIPLLLHQSFSFPPEWIRLILQQEIILLQALLPSVMNILDFQEMTTAQQKLLSLQSYQEYQLQALDQALIGHLSNFSSCLFAPAEAELLQQVHKSLKSVQNVVILKASQSSDLLKIFTYAVVSIIVPPSKCSLNKQRKGNQLLVETIKCSLYSKDIKFPQLSSIPFSTDSLQAKAMIARFFNLLTHSTLTCDLQKNKYAEWLLENHPILLQSFTVFFRIILYKLDVEDASNQTKELDFSKTVTNLVEFFDINYRNQGDLFLFPDDNYFLASVDGSFVFGQYLQNGKKEDQPLKQQQSGKDSSYLRKVTNQESLRKNGVIEGDMKVFNFMLESGRSSILEKDDGSLTPHFQNNNEFAFGRKKKDEDQIAKHQHFQREFQKILLNSDSESLREKEIQALFQLNDVSENQVIPAMESKKRKKSNENHENLSDYGQENLFLLRKDTFGKQNMLEIDAESQDNQMINPEQSNSNKNIVSVKDKQFATFSPPAPKAGSFEHFSSSVNDNKYFQPDYRNDYLKYSRGKLEEISINQLGNCHCVQLKKKRNNVVSKVVDFMFLPFRIRNYGCRSPKFLNNLKHSQDIVHNSPKIKVTPPKPLKNNVQQTSVIIKENRTPNFIKGLKKDKEKADKNSVSSKSKEKISIKDYFLSPSHPKNMNTLNLDKQQRRDFNTLTKFSAILTRNPKQSKTKQSKSTTRKNESSSLPKYIMIEQAGTINRFDSQFTNVRPGLGKNNWKSIEKFHVPQVQITQKKQPTQFDENTKQDATGITKISAPASIFASSVHFKGRNQHTNKAICRINDGYDKKRSKERRPCRIQAKSEQMRFIQFRKKT